MKIVTKHEERKTPCDFIDYEAFGAVGDGVTDDLPAICEAHSYANKHGLAVRSRHDATYHLGRQALTAVIATDTDWNTSRFTIDDTEVDDHRVSLFEVRSLLDPEPVAIPSLMRNQSQVEARPSQDCHVVIENQDHRIFIRRGLNQNYGKPQCDCFVLRRNGTVEGAITWDYDKITRIEARPIDEAQLVIKGGIFTTHANRMKQEVGYNYWARNIKISRSNMEVDGLTHYVVGETAWGHPYSGFMTVQQCAEVTLRNCFVSGHKIYSTLGAAGKPVKMGSYDLGANMVVDFKMIGCRMNHILDETRWGVIGTNFCKNILLEDCTLSRMDTHMGVADGYTIRGCTLGHMGLNAIGRGRLIVEDTTFFGNSMIALRGDYGSTWDGEIVIRRCRWIPASGEQCQYQMIKVSNDGMHDFGYSCSMPGEVTIDGMFVDDSIHPENYQGATVFSDHDRDNPHESVTEESLAERPFPYALCQRVSIQGLTTASGKPPRISPNPEVQKFTKLSILPQTNFQSPA